MKKKILLLSTGGTIASKPGPEGLAPSIGSDDILSMIGVLIQNYEVFSKDLLHLDSSNIQPEEWRIIAREVYHCAAQYDGIVITHGTDTMAYTTSILAFMLRNVPIPVVVTGSQLPLEHPLTDGFDNLRTAFAMAASQVPGVFLAFNRKVILGARAVKIRTTGFDAFESVNCDYAGTVDAGGLNINHQVIPPVQGRFVLEDTLCTDVFLIKLTPGLNPEIFDMLLTMNYRGIVIEAFGAGGLHFIHRDLVSKLQKIADHGISVVVCSQCLFERSDFSIYQTGQKVLEKGVIQGFDMTTEAAVTKLIWALGQSQNCEQVRKIFSQSYVGEVAL
ncbi:asparaginase [Youxingia wuxianensis]|uniref:asparaginase n=1 Tax=Youxingia wuxianensis TaxID=2763678 RepID=A0A926EU72_9FIRM|nr:asparaginase [Youxingia wuxianensis]MBC8586419.1 asparaginase [Youxingia wuxianensis]